MNEFTENEVLMNDSEDIAQNVDWDCTREEYDMLMSGVFKKFYEQDVTDLKNEIMPAQKREESPRSLSDNEWEKIKEAYPECMPEAEMQSKLFTGLVNLLGEQEDFNPVSIYEMAHLDEIKKLSEKKGEVSAEKSIINRIKSRKLRPDENGISKAGAATGRNVADMTRAERASLAARAAKGEHIKL